MNRRKLETHRRPDRGGFALPVAVLAMVVVGVLVTAGFFMAQQESRIGVASKNSSMAFYIAEQGMNEVMANWSAARYSQVPMWAADTVTGSISQGTYTVSIHHLTDFMYFVESQGVVTEGGRLAGATRKLGMIAKIRTAWIDPPAALTTQGDVTVGGTAMVNGNDSIPNGWDGICDAGALEDKPGVMHDSEGSASESGSGDILGTDPPVVENDNINDSTFLDYGDLTWDDLIEYASVQLGTPGSLTTLSGIVPTVSGGECSRVNTNWGEPYTADSDVSAGETVVPECSDYFPLVHVSGNLRLQGTSRGQGILLVGDVTYNQDGTVASMEGDLDLRGNFTWNGIIIVLGQFETQAGAAPRVTGGVLAGNADLEDCTGAGCIENLLGASIVQYSSCAIEQAILNNADLAKARPFLQRSWVDLSNLSYN